MLREIQVLDSYTYLIIFAHNLVLQILELTHYFKKNAGYGQQIGVVQVEIDD